MEFKLESKLQLLTDFLRKDSKKSVPWVSTCLVESLYKVRTDKNKVTTKRTVRQWMSKIPRLWLRGSEGDFLA